MCQIIAKRPVIRSKPVPQCDHVQYLVMPALRILTVCPLGVATVDEGLDGLAHRRELGRGGAGVNPAGLTPEVLPSAGWKHDPSETGNKIGTDRHWHSQQGGRQPPSLEWRPLLDPAPHRRSFERSPALSCGATSLVCTNGSSSSPRQGQAHSRACLLSLHHCVEHRADIHRHVRLDGIAIVKADLEIELSAFHVPGLHAVAGIAVIVDQVGEEHQVY